MNVHRLRLTCRECHAHQHPEISESNELWCSRCGEPMVCDECGEHMTTDEHTHGPKEN